MWWYQFSKTAKIIWVTLDGAMLMASLQADFIAKSRGMSLTHVKSVIRIRIFTFYISKAEQYTSVRVQNVGCVYYCCCSYYAAARYTWNSRLAVVDFNWRHLIAKPLTHTSVRCKDLSDICCTSRGIAHFVLNFVAMATRIGHGKIQLAAFEGPFPKTPTQVQKISQISLTQAEL